MVLRVGPVIALLVVSSILAGCAGKAPDDSNAGAGSNAGISNLGGAPGTVVTSVFPGEYNFTGPLSRVVLPGLLKILPGERAIVPSPIDGADIEMGLHRPDTTEKVPILLFSSPYMDAEDSLSREIGQAVQPISWPQNPLVNKPGIPPTTINPSNSVKSLIENFVPHGYAVVTHSVRGTGGSDGCNDLMGPMEMADIEAALNWLGTQPWSSGAIAMTGVSYDGSTPWTAAATGNQYVKTIIPISGVPDMYGLMYRNGSAETRGPVLLNAIYVQGSVDSGEATAAPARFCAEAAEGVALSGVAGLIGTDPTGYWQSRNRKPAVEANYKGSVFSVQGLQDWNVDPSQVVPWVDQLEAKGLKTKQLLGQWAHSWPDNIGADGAGMDCPAGNPAVKSCDRADWKEALLHWLDSELKGMDVDTGPAVQVTDSLGRWRNEAHYPPHDTNWTTYHLNGELLSLEPGARASAMLYPSLEEDFPPNPPSNVDLGVKKAADFVLGPVAEDLLIVGLPKVHVTVTPSGPGGYMAAYLYEVDRNGTSTRLGWTTMNLAFADGSTTRKEVVPGTPIQAMMEIQPMDGVIRKGSQLMLRIWVFTDGDRLPTIPPAPVSLEMGGSIETVLKLPTVVRGPEVYFEPPMPAKK